MNRFTLVCADMAGTTISDDGIVEQAALTALDVGGLAIGSPEHDGGMKYVRDTMGTSKIEVFRAIMPSEQAAQATNAAFEATIEKLAASGHISALPGVVEAIARLRDHKIQVALTTGFAAATQTAILNALGWQDLIDFAITPGDGIRGRPYPDMVLRSLLRLGIDDVRQVAVIGDSVNDVHSGLRAGAGVVAGVTTGAHDMNALRRAGATHVLESFAQLPDLLTT